jgi:hypothetical protein
MALGVLKLGGLGMKPHRVKFLLPGKQLIPVV